MKRSLLFFHLKHKHNYYNQRDTHPSSPTLLHPPSSFSLKVNLEKKDLNKYVSA